MTQKTRKILSLAAFGIFILLSAFVCVKIGGPLVRYAKEPERFRQWVDGNGMAGRLVYVGMIVLQVIVAVIPGEPFELLGGYAFGAVEGTILCVIGAFIGSVIVFLLVRKFGVMLVKVFFEEEKLQKLKFLQSSPKRNYLYLIIYIIPGTPKDLLSYFAGLTDIRLPMWLLICSLGRLPSVVTSTVGGSAVNEQNYLFAAAVFIGTLALSLIGVAVYNRICRKHGKT